MYLPPLEHRAVSIGIDGHRDAIEANRARTFELPDEPPPEEATVIAGGA